MATRNLAAKCYSGVPQGPPRFTNHCPQIMHLACAANPLRRRHRLPHPNMLD